MNRPALRRASALLLGVVAVAMAAQPAAQTREPERPRLDADADTNDAQAYFQYGLRSIAKRPSRAAAAFYWASRLAPPWADPYYGRATALILAERSRLMRYILRDKAVMETSEVQEIDSLYLAAYARNPFLVTRLDFYIYEEYMRQATGSEAVGLFRGKTGNAGFDGWMAYTQGNHRNAIRFLATAVKRDPEELGHHVLRARAFAALSEIDSALAEMGKALEKMREQDRDRLEHAFESLAMFEHSVAYLHMQRGDDSLAREAYERAAVADLSFYPAHIGLGDLAVKQGDTATAVREYAQAVELRPGDAGLHAGYAIALIQAHRQAEAAQALERAIELEPYFAQPYFLLARLLDLAEFSDQAIARYEQYLQRSARGMPEREWVEGRLAALRSGGS